MFGSKEFLRQIMSEMKSDFYRCGGWLLTLILLSLSSQSQAAITFTFNYNDPNGIGFNAVGATGQERRTALEQTGVLLSNAFPRYTATINLDVNGAETNDSTLAAAASNFNSNDALTCNAGFKGRGDVGIKILGGVDPKPQAADGLVTVNFQDHVWDLDDNIDFMKFDFKSTMLHELLHAMGFSNSIRQDGSDPCGVASPNPAGWSPFDKHLGNTSAAFINTSFVINRQAWLASVTGGTGNSGLLWRGVNAVAANNGSPIPMFSPTNFSSGSSVAHLDDDFYSNVNLLMESATGVGPGIRTLAPIEFGIMKDIGIDNSSDPLPPQPPVPSPENSDFYIIPLKSGKAVIFSL